MSLKKWALKPIIREWFTREGLVAPDEIDVTPFELIADDKIRVNDRLMERRMLEMQAYHLQEPIGEVNLGHPIEHTNGDIVRSSAAKQLGFYLRELLVMNVLETGDTQAAVPATQSRYDLSQDILPQAYRLEGAEKELFDHLVHKHNEIFATVSESTQMELLLRLSAWIQLAREISGNRFESIVAAIIKAEENPGYGLEFERFLYEFRQFSTFSDFYKTMSWLMLTQVGDADILAVAKNLSGLSNILSRMHVIIGEVERNIVGHQRVRIRYGDEDTEDRQAVPRTQKVIDINDMVEKYNAADRDDDIEDMCVAIAPQFTTRDGKTVLVYQQGVEAFFGGRASDVFLSDWQKLMDEEFGRRGWIRRAVIDGQERLLMGKRNSTLIYVIPRSSIIEGTQEEPVIRKKSQRH